MSQRKAITTSIPTTVNNPRLIPCRLLVCFRFLWQKLFLTLIVTPKTELVAKHVPQIQSLLASAQGQGSSNTSTTTQSNPNNPVPNATSQAAQTTNGTRSVPFFSRGKKKAQPQLNVSTKQTTDDLRCIIPGCKQPGYVDEEGLVSDFCSLRHRE